MDKVENFECLYQEYGILEEEWVTDSQQSSPGRLSIRSQKSNIWMDFPSFLIGTIFRPNLLVTLWIVFPSKNETRKGRSYHPYTSLPLIFFRLVTICNLDNGHVQ